MHAQRITLFPCILGTHVEVFHYSLTVEHYSLTVELLNPEPIKSASL